MNGGPVLSDQELKVGFESCALAPEQWGHREHIRMAFLYAAEHLFASAVNCMRVSLQAFNAAKHVSESLERGYHETITVAYMRLVADSRRRNGPFADSEAFCPRHPELLDKRALRKFYSPERIMTWEAKRRFVAPDVADLPPEPSSCDERSSCMQRPTYPLRADCAMLSLRYSRNCSQRPSMRKTWSVSSMISRFPSRSAAAPHSCMSVRSSGIVRTAWVSDSVKQGAL